MPSQESLQNRDIKAFFFKRLNYLPANELRLLFLILRKVIFENKSVLNTWGKVNFMEALPPDI